MVFAPLRPVLGSVLTVALSAITAHASGDDVLTDAFTVCPDYAHWCRRNSFVRAICRYTCRESIDNVITCDTLWTVSDVLCPSELGLSQSALDLARWFVIDNEKEAVTRCCTAAETTCGSFNNDPIIGDFVCPLQESCLMSLASKSQDSCTGLEDCTATCCMDISVQQEDGSSHCPATGGTSDPDSNIEGFSMSANTDEQDSAWWCKKFVRYCNTIPALAAYCPYTCRNRRAAASAFGNVEAASAGVFMDEPPTCDVVKSIAQAARTTNGSFQPLSAFAIDCLAADGR